MVELHKTNDIDRICTFSIMHRIAVFPWRLRQNRFHNGCLCFKDLNKIWSSKRKHFRKKYTHLHDIKKSKLFQHIHLHYKHWKTASNLWFYQYLLQSFFKDYPVSKINSFKDEIHLCIIVWTISSVVIHFTLMSFDFVNQLNNKIYKNEGSTNSEDTTQ